MDRALENLEKSLQLFEEASQWEARNPLIKKMITFSNGTTRLFKKILKPGMENPLTHVYTPLFYSEALLNAGKTYYNAGFNAEKPDTTKEYYDKAIGCFRKGLSLEDSANEFLFYNLLALISNLKGEFADAAENYHKSIVLSPTDATLYGNLASNYKEWKKNGAALWAYQEAIEISKDNKQQAGFYNKKGIMLQDDNKWPEATDAFLKAMTCDSAEKSYAKNLIDAWNTWRDPGKKFDQAGQDKTRESVENMIVGTALNLTDPDLCDTVKTAFNLSP